MITIVTDSSAYLKKQEALELGVKVVPFSYTVNGRVYYESYGDDNVLFEDMLKSDSELTTSGPNPTAFLSCFEEALASGGDVLCITISSRLSGTYSAAHIAAKQADSRRVAVLDSQLTAGGLYLLIKQAREMAKDGWTLNDIVNRLEQRRDGITTAFSVDDMAPLRKSGRIGFVRMSVETILNKRPVLLLDDGVVVSGSVARGSADVVKKLARMVSADACEIVINYIDNCRLAANLRNVLGEAFPEVEMSLQKIGPVLGIHLGLNVVGVSFVTRGQNIRET